MFYASETFRLDLILFFLSSKQVSGGRRNPLILLQPGCGQVSDQVARCANSHAEV